VISWHTGILAPHCRTLRQELEYSVEAANLEQLPRVGEAIAALEMAIASAAEEFDDIPNPPIPNLKIATSNAVGEAQPLSIYFTIDSLDQATVWFIEIDMNASEL
jgi:hypothetical protein